MDHAPTRAANIVASAACGQHRPQRQNLGGRPPSRERGRNPRRWSRLRREGGLRHVPAYPLRPVQPPDRAGHESGCDDAVEPVVVGGEHDGHARQERVREDQPARARLRDANDAVRNDERPTDMQRRHRRELIREFSNRLRAIWIRAVQHHRVDEARHHARRREREQQVNAERRGSHREQNPANPAVITERTNERPHQERDGADEVERHVVAVHRDDKIAMRENQPLQRCLRIEREPMLPLEHAIRVRERGVDLVLPEVPDELVDPQHSREQHELACEHAAVLRTPEANQVVASLLFHAPCPYPKGLPQHYGRTAPHQTEMVGRWRLPDCS